MSNKNKLDNDDAEQDNFWKSILEGDHLDPDYLRHLGGELDLRVASSTSKKKRTPELLDAIRTLKNRDHFSIETIVKILCKYGAKKNEVLKAYEIVKQHDKEIERIENAISIYKNPVIITPGLNKAVGDFESHFDVSGDEPIMVSGPTGVGKSLFLYLAKRLFLKKHENAEDVPPIVEANCGHFAGKRADFNIGRSELFGHVKGAYTGADEDKKGLVEKANGGLLILEEVGELPFETQAMLLTFIETGEYRKLGDEEVFKAKAKIVAATNRESDLRADFRYRFFPFYISPLRERKQDILYYFYEIFPELTKRFTRSEVLLLLAHHWPGNVREIERIGRLIMRQNRIYNQASSGGPGPEDNRSTSNIYHLDPRDTSFDPEALINIRGELGQWGVDTDFLEKLLNKHRISLNSQNNELAFPEFAKTDGYSAWMDEFALKFCEDYPPFEEAYNGYLCFCELFLQDPEKANNLLTTLRECSWPPKIQSTLEYPASYADRVNKLKRDIMHYLQGVSDPDYKWPLNLGELWAALGKMKKQYNRSKKGQVSIDELVFEVAAQLKEADLLRHYYQKILEQTGGNVKAAAKRTGLLETTFRSRMEKLEMKFKKRGASK
jgi:transcriptional regulator with AAA-type ATPase domain